MKKAYNVYEKAYIPAFLRKISLALVFGVCFLGFQTQSTAQAAYPDAINASAVDRSDIKELYTEFDLSSVTAEDAKTSLKEYGSTIRGVEQSTTEGELEQIVSIDFIIAINQALDQGASVVSAVEQAYVSTLNSQVVVANGSYFNAPRTLEKVIEVLD